MINAIQFVHKFVIFMQILNLLTVCLLCLVVPLTKKKFFSYCYCLSSPFFYDSHAKQFMMNLFIICIYETYFHHFFFAGKNKTCSCATFQAWNMTTHTGSWPVIIIIAATERYTIFLLSCVYLCIWEYVRKKKFAWMKLN